MTDAPKDVAQLVESMVIALVDEPEHVKVTANEEGDDLFIEVAVAPDDTGKIIGRQGRVIKSIRTLARAAASYTGDRHVEVEVVG